MDAAFASEPLAQKTSQRRVGAGVVHRDDLRHRSEKSALLLQVKVKFKI